MRLCKLTRVKDSEQVFINPSNIVALLPLEGGTRVVTNASGPESSPHGINVMETPDLVAAMLEKL